MKKHAAISIVLWWMLSCIWFFSIVCAQQYTSKIVSHINRVEDQLNFLPFFVENYTQLASFLNFLPFPNATLHAAADINDVYSIHFSQVNAFFDASTTFDEFYQKVRSDVIQYLVSQRYSAFNIKPYTTGWDYALMVVSWDFIVMKDIQDNDNLDLLLNSKLSVLQNEFIALKKYKQYFSFKNISFTQEEYNNLWTLYLFKNEQDLRDLWYTLVSWRSRLNADKDYRRHNIRAAFKNIGNVRLIMPNETFDLVQEVHYNPLAPDGKEPFVDGYAILGNNVKMIYGWWLCAVGTALYQGTLANLWLSLIQARGHSIYYRNLYEAEIDGDYISTPWLDATVYSPYFDVKIKNIREYPIIAVFNFDGVSGHYEQMFTLSKTEDKGTFEFVGSYEKSWLKCYTRKIRGENRTNCYRQITRS